MKKLRALILSALMPLGLIGGVGAVAALTGASPAFASYLTCASGDNLLADNIAWVGYNNLGVDSANNTIYDNYTNAYGWAVCQHSIAGVGVFYYFQDEFNGDLVGVGSSNQLVIGASGAGPHELWTITDIGSGVLNMKNYATGNYVESYASTGHPVYADTTSSGATGYNLCITQNDDCDLI